MRFMILRKADTATEAGVMPGEELLAAMACYNEALLDAGVLIDGDGLQPSARGARVTFSGGQPVVSDGPFAETRELLAGYLTIRADSLQEAVEWAKRWPPLDGASEGDVHLEIRQLCELEDFEQGEAIASHTRLRERMARQPAGMCPYLLFDGNCREAFEFYADCLGGHIDTMMTYGESPMAGEFAPEMHDRIVHVCMRAGSWTLMGSDAPPDYFEQPAGYSVQLAIADPERAERLFERLAEGGTIRMPFAETFWAHRFGVLVDRFGTPWMINCEQPR